MKTIQQQITFRHKLAYYLDMGYLQYESLRHLYFLDWCKKVAEQKYIPLEALTRNDHLLNWFEEQWYLLVEREIERLYGPDMDKGIFDERDMALLVDIFYKGMTFYPQVLLNEINKNKIVENESIR